MAHGSLFREYVHVCWTRVYIVNCKKMNSKSTANRRVYYNLKETCWFIFESNNGQVLVWTCTDLAVNVKSFTDWFILSTALEKFSCLRNYLSSHSLAGRNTFFIILAVYKYDTKLFRQDYKITSYSDKLRVDINIFRMVIWNM